MRLPRESFDRYCMTTEINTPQTYKLIGVYIFSSCQSDFPSLASGQGASRMDFGTLAPGRRPARGLCDSPLSPLTAGQWRRTPTKPMNAALAATVGCRPRDRGDYTETRAGCHSELSAKRTGRLFSQPREQTVSVKRPPSCTQAAGPAGLPSPDHVASPVKLVKARRPTEEPKSIGTLPSKMSFHVSGSVMGSQIGSEA